MVEGLSSTFHNTSCRVVSEFWREQLWLKKHKNMVTGFDRTHSLEEPHILHESTKLNMSTCNQELEQKKFVFHCVVK